MQLPYVHELGRFECWTAVRTLSRAEASSFIHVDPETVIGKQVVEIRKASIPHSLGLRVKPVNEDGLVRPHLHDERSVILIRIDS